LSDQPTPPIDVYWVVPDPPSDPLKFPVQCHFDGTSGDGYTQWSVSWPLVTREGMYLHIGWMDAKHAIIDRPPDNLTTDDEQVLRAAEKAMLRRFDQTDPPTG
jgi:hypothetical protein